MIFPKYSLENSSDPILCSYTGKKLFKSNRLQFSHNRCLNTQYVPLYYGQTPHVNDSGNTKGIVCIHSESKLLTFEVDMYL